MAKMLNPERMRGPLGRAMAESDACDSQHHNLEGKGLRARRKQYKGGVESSCFLLYPINTRGLGAESCRPWCERGVCILPGAEGSKFWHIF